MDWNLKHIIGNLKKTSYNEMYFSEEFQKINRALSNPNSDLLCRQCEKDIVQRSSFNQFIKNMDNLLKGRKLY
jgi:sulfatase maturation enzyme AslB (radical SAM superfamily)